MEKTISAFEARRNFGRVLQEVMSNNDNVIVERHGEPVAVVVPVEVYKQWQRSRQAFFDWLRSVSERIDASEEEAEELIPDAPLLLPPVARPRRPRPALVGPAFALAPACWSLRPQLRRAPR